LKLWKTVSLVLWAIVIIAMGYGIVLVRGGFSARGTPSTVEKFAATTARKLAVPSKYRQLRNPLRASPENIRAGMEHFADHCAFCHANDGSGDTMFGKGMYPKPPDLHTAGTQKMSDGELYYTIENGVRLSGMPAFGEEHVAGGDADTWKLVLFIRHLPNLTADELQQMTQLNPKTEEERQEEKQEGDFLRGDSPQTQGTNHIRTKGEQ
jgi:mono/diheme cytochrome c family protein